MSIESVVKAINKYNSFIVCAHVRLEGDALGSQIALANLLKKFKKKVFMVNNDKPPANYKFLPGVDSIKNKFSIDMDAEAIIFVDCSDKDRAGEIEATLPKDLPTINIDHHISNSHFCKVNWVDPQASSTAEMIYRLFLATEIPVDENDALLLYVAILTDTGSFRYPNTTAFTHEMAADLLKHNLSVNRIYQQIYETNTFSDIIAICSVVSTLEKYKHNKVVCMELSTKVLGKKKLHIDQAENILSFARSIKDVEVIILLKETESEDITRVSFRSHGKVDVNKLAAHFGGGGHKTASGCTIKEDIETAKTWVLKALDKEMERLKL